MWTSWSTVLVCSLHLQICVFQALGLQRSTHVQHSSGSSLDVGHGLMPNPYRWQIIWPLTLIMNVWQVCHLKDEHWLPATPADATRMAAPSTAQRGSDAVLLNPSLAAKLAASLAGAAGKQTRQERTGLEPISSATGITSDVAQQQRRLQLSEADFSDEAAAALADAGADQPAGAALCEQGAGSSEGSARKLNLFAYKRGPAARLGSVRGTDPAVCSLRCDSSVDSELEKVR